MVRSVHITDQLRGVRDVASWHEDRSGDRGGGQRPAFLEGIRLLDITGALAGPYCTTILGDLGAEVIKVEPVEGDALRRRLVGPERLSLPFDLVHRGKRSLAVDIVQHFLPVTFAQYKSLLHLYYCRNTARPQQRARIMTGSMTARRAGWSSSRFTARLVKPYSSPVSIRPNWIGERGQ